MSSLGRLRRLWFNVHMWLGVGLSLVLIPLALSGSYEVWQDEIDVLTHPGRFAVSAPQLSLPPGAYLEAAQAAFGDRARVSQLRMPDHAGAPVIVTGPMGRGDGGPRGGKGRTGRGGQARDSGAAGAAGQAAPRGRSPTLTAWLDPGTARVLDVADTSGSFKQWIHRLHGSLQLPANGRTVVGWLGWAMLGSSLTGLWLWWPRNGRLIQGLAWRRSPSTLLNLHHMVGFWVCLPLAVLSLTGALISFPQAFRGAVGAIAPVSAQQQQDGGGRGGGSPMREPNLMPDDAARVALAATPGATLTSLTLPSRDRPVWRAQVTLAGKTQDVTVADETGAASLVPARAVPAGDAIVRWNRRIHDGDGTGLLWKVIITLAGLAPAALGVTGVIVWARRQLRKLAPGRQLAAAE